jgi:hypothetical protein
MTNALIVRDDASLTVSFTAAAEELKLKALESAALVGRVSNADEQEAAVNAQKALAEILSVAEKARKACKEPVLEFGRRIDGAAHSFLAELKSEQMRLAKLVGDFQQLELAKVRAAQVAENERLAELERERHAEAAKAQSHDQLDAIHAKFDIRAREESVAVQPARVSGQIVKPDWEFSVEDQWAFVRWAMATGNTECLDISPRRSEIKALLKVGQQIPGIKSWPVVNATVRAGRQPLAISI